MTGGKLSWTEMLDAIAARQSEALGVVLGTDMPYFDNQVTEQILVEVSNMILREVPKVELEALGSTAMTTSTYANGAAIPIDRVRVVGASIDGKACDEPVLPAGFYQNRFSVYAGYSANIFTFGEGNVYFNGALITLTTVRECTLAEWQADGVSIAILPAKYDMERINAVHQILSINNHLENLTNERKGILQ